MVRRDSLEQIRELLVQRRDALRQALNGDDRLLKTLNSQQGGDEVDFAMDCSSGEISSRLAEVESREMQNLDVALNRFESDTYGTCEACTCNIPLARLQALPCATVCIACKLKAEEAGLEPGAVSDWSVILGNEGGDVQIGDMDFNIS